MTMLIRFMATVLLILSPLGGCTNPGAVADSTVRLLRVAADQSRPKPYAAESNVRLTEEEQGQRLVLDEDRQREALATLKILAEGHEVTQRLGPAEHGVRWRDVPLAVRHAVREVEMAIVRQRGRPVHDEIVFSLTTVDERPARLVVTRTHDNRVYEASATVGRFADDAVRAQRLVAALHENLLALGRKRGFE